MVTGAAGCSLAGGPSEAGAITYEVHYARIDEAGTAEVAYTESDGTTVSTVVYLPWVSDEIDVRPGTSYRVQATTTPLGNSHFYCGVHTDSGWNAGESEPGGSCAYTYPDDVGE